MKIKKYTAMIMAAVITCTAPVSIYASDINTDAIVEEIVENDKVGELLTNPEQTADIIISAKNLVQAQNLSDGEIGTAVSMAAGELGITLSESEQNMIVSIASKLVNTDITDEEIRSKVNDIYATMEKLGIGKEEVKGILKKLINFAKTFVQ